MPPVVVPFLAPPLCPQAVGPAEGMQADYRRLPQWPFRLIIFNFEECPAYFVSFLPPPFHFPPSLQQDTEPSRVGLVWDRDGGFFVSLVDF